MSDLTLQEFRPLPPGKELGDMLREEARIIRGEPEGIATPAEQARQEAGHVLPHPNLLTWFRRHLRALTAGVQVH